MRIATFLAAGLIGLFSLGLLGAGGLLLWGDAQKDEHGFISTATERFATTTYAMATENLDADTGGSDWVIERRAKLRVEVTPRGDKPLFVGIARTGDVADYLRGTHHALVTDVEYAPFRADYRELAGDARPERPAAQSFWAASAHGAGLQEITWEVEDGDWSIVVMNEDASAAVDAGVKAGADVPFLRNAGWGALLAGVGALAFAAGLAAVGVRASRRAAVAA